ncbi:hypothetical protein Tco_1119866 [Tanacetum coccineum]
MVSPLNDDQIDFRISFDESDDEDYIVIFTVMAHLPVRAQRYLWLRYEVEGYTEEIVYDFEGILDTIFGRQVNRVHILDFKGLTEEMRETLTSRLRMVYTRTEGHVLMSDTELGLDVADTLCFQLGGARRGMTWRQFILALGLHTEEMALRHTSISKKSQAPEKVTATDLFYLRSMDEGMVVNVPYLLAQYFLVTDEGLIGLTVIARKLLVIDMDELVRLRFCNRLGDTCAWVASGPKRQPVAAAEAPKGVEGAPVVDEGVQAISAPLHVPQPPPVAAPTRTIPQRMTRLGEEVYRLRESLGEQREVLDAMSRDFSRFTTWMVGRLSQLLDVSGMSYMSYSDYQIPYQRRIKQRTDGVNSLYGISMAVGYGVLIVWTLSNPLLFCI